MLFLLLSLAALGQTPAQVSLEVDKTTVPMDGSVTLKVRVQADTAVSEPDLPDLPGFDAYLVGTGSTITQINGSIATEAVYTYVLSPKKIGKHTIGPVEVLGGLSQQVEIEVTPGAHQSPTVEPPPADVSQRDPVFVTAEVSNKTPYAGEPVSYIFRLYRSVPARIENYAPPAMLGFLTEDLPPERQYSTTLDGAPYEVTELRTALIATHAGEAKVTPASLTVTYYEPLPQLYLNDPFQLAFRPERTRQLKAEDLTVDVRDLPTEGRPADFSGAVGSYTMKAWLDKSEVKVGEPVNLQITVEGEGNVQLLNQFPLPAFPGMRAYDTQVSGSLDKSDYRLRGTRVFTTTLVPQQPGTRVLKGLQMSYFDPSTEKYVTLKAEPLELKVTGQAAAARPAAKDPMRGQKRSIGKRPFTLPDLGIYQVIPLALLAGALALRSWRRFRELNAESWRRSAALRQARAHLQGLRRLKVPLQGKRVLEAVHGFLEAKLGRSMAGLSRSELGLFLAEKDVPGEEAAALLSLLEAAEAAAYSPAGQPLADRDVFGLLKRLEARL